jgi:hypothetical protein
MMLTDEVEMAISLDRFEDFDEVRMRRQLSEEERFAKKTLGDEGMMGVERSCFDRVLEGREKGRRARRQERFQEQGRFEESGARQGRRKQQEARKGRGRQICLRQCSSRSSCQL